MDKNFQRAVNGPSLFEVIFGAILSLAFGVLLAIVWLIVKPVTTLKEPTSELVPNMVYYLPGETNNTTSRTWMRKRQLLAEGSPGVITLSEAELNAWASATLKPPAADASTIVPGQLNFRIRDGLMQIASPSTLHLFGIPCQVVFQMRGDFRKKGDVFAFHPQEMFVGSLAIHSLPGLMDRFMKKLGETQILPEDVAAAWNKASNVVLDTDSLQITLP